MKIIAASTMSVLDSCLVCTSTSTRGLQVLLWSIERSNRCRTASHPTTSYVVSIHVYADVMCGSTALVVRPSQSGKYCSPGPLLRALRGIVPYNPWVQHPCRSGGGGRAGSQPRVTARGRPVTDPVIQRHLLFRVGVTAVLHTHDHD